MERPLDSLISNVIPVLLLIRAPVDASPVWIQDNGQLLCLHATVSDRLSLSIPSKKERERELFSLLAALGSCPLSTLFDFIGTTVGITIDQSKNFVYTNGIDDSQALGGSNITLNCQDGYTNLGGPLTIVCTVQNTWSPFPQCVSTTTTTQSAPRCPYTSDTLQFANGYVSQSSNLLLYSDNTAQGRGRVWV